MRRARKLRSIPPGLGTITSALAATLVGYALCARRTSDPTVAVAATNAAASASNLLDTIVREAAAHGVDLHPRTRMSDRLRWEWIASTGSVRDGGDARILAECARVLGEVVSVDVSPLGQEIASRVRLASAEAWSLASAVAAGARWRSEARGVAFL